MLPTARNAPSHSRPLTRALSGLSTGSGSTSGAPPPPGAGDASGFLQGEWGLTFGERLRVLARTQALTQPRPPFAMPAPRPIPTGKSPAVAQLAVAPVAPLPPAMAPTFWQQQSTPLLSPNISLFRPAPPLQLQPPPAFVPVISPTLPHTPTTRAQVVNEAQSTPDLQRTSRKRKRGVAQPKPDVAVGPLAVGPSLGIASFQQVERPPLRTAGESIAAVSLLGVRAQPHRESGPVKTLSVAQRDLSNAMGRMRRQVALARTDTPSNPADSSLVLDAAPRVADIVTEGQELAPTMRNRRPQESKPKPTRDLVHAQRVLGGVLGRLRQRHAQVRDAAPPAPMAPTAYSDSLDAVIQEARARRLSTSDPAAAETRLARAMQDLRQQHVRVRVRDNAREFDVRADFDTLDVAAGSEVDLQDISIARAVAADSFVNAQRQAYVHLDTKVDRSDPQALKRFCARVVMSVARRKTSRLLSEEQLLRHPDRAAFFGAAVHQLLLQGKYAAACTVHGWMCDEGFVSSPAIVTALVRALDDGEGVLQALDDMPAHVDQALLAAALSRLQHSLTPAHLEDVAARYSYKGGRGVTSIMINAHAQAGDIASAAQWLKRYRKLERPGRVLEPAPYAALMAAHLRENDPRAALGVLALMQDDDVAPTLAIYNMLLSARPGPKEDLNAAVERAFRVAKVLPPDIWARADAYTFAALWKAHERWRATLILRTGAPQPTPRALFRTMMERARGRVGARLMDVVLRVLIQRNDYAGALVALDMHRRPDAATRAAVLGALWRRMRGEVLAQQAEEERVREREQDLRDRGRLVQSADEPGVDLARWTDRMLAEPGGLRRRGSWLREYVARGGALADFDGVCEWLLDLGPELELEPAKDGQPGIIDVRPLRVLLRRAILASKGVSALAPLEVREQVLRSRLWWAREEMLPPPPREPLTRPTKANQGDWEMKWTPEKSEKDLSL